MFAREQLVEDDAQAPAIHLLSAGDSTRGIVDNLGSYVAWSAHVASHGVLTRQSKIPDEDVPHPIEQNVFQLEVTMADVSAENYAQIF